MTVPPAGSPAAPAAERLAVIDERIAAACRRAGRPPGSVTLVAASKTQPAEAVRPFVDAGLRLLGENRVQEALAKSRQLALLMPPAAGPAAPASQAAAAPPAPLAPPAPNIEWHLIGPLQSNKIRQALDLFTCIHSLDRAAIVTAVDREAARRGLALTGFIEVNLAGEPSKHGFGAADLAVALRPLAALPALRIVGLMAIPPQEESDAAARAWFRRLRELRDALGALPEWAGWPGYLSMGMSDDFEAAIAEGATHVRVGTALFGPRVQPLSMLR